MNYSIIIEIHFLADCIVVGAVLAVVYDILRVWRRICRHGTVWIAVEDFLYWCMAAVALFYFLCGENNGILRGFVFGGIFLGIYLVNTWISPYTVRGIAWFFNSCIRFFVRPFAAVKRKNASGPHRREGAGKPEP